MPDAVTGYGNNANDIRTTYMNLLVTLLRHQNPLEPMDNKQMAAQLAQLSSLEQLENLNSSFQKVLLSQQVSEANSLIGREISFMIADQDEPLSETVSAVELVGGEVRLRAGDYLVEPAGVLRIADAQ